jgi:hypothetical protein
MMGAPLPLLAGTMAGAASFVVCYLLLASVLL